MTIKIQDVLRAGHVKRWNIINTTRQQTLAEHLFNVAMISDIIMSKLDCTEHRDIVLAWSLIHDVPEVVCGDTPTPTKKRMEDFGFSMEKVYDDIDPTYKETKQTVQTVSFGLPYDIVKISDLIESIHFLTENGVGSHARNVANSIHGKLIKKIEEFDIKHSSILPAFVEGSSMGVKESIMTVYDEIMKGHIYE